MCVSVYHCTVSSVFVVHWNDDQHKEPMIDTKIIYMGNQQVRMPIYGSVLGGVRLCLKAQPWCDIGHV